VRLTYLFATIVALVLALAIACSGDDGNAPIDSPTSTRNQTPNPSVTETPPPLPTDTLVFTNGAGESVELSVEIADEPSERAQGLMFRKQLPDDGGMLFLYDEDHIGAFWMKDTLIPLSIAFVTADGTIIDIQDMEPLAEDLHRPPDVYRNAIEANQGWFDRHGIAVGDTVSIPGV
jgi:uncharacterized membrane protein (UPF0127 family)